MYARSQSPYISLCFSYYIYFNVRNIFSCRPVGQQVIYWCVYDVITEMGMRRLQTLIQSLLLRRTKQDIGSDGQPLVKKDHVNWC